MHGPGGSVALRSRFFCSACSIFSGWARHLRRCSACGLVYEPRPGDTWAFTVLLDRLPLAALIALVYFGIFRGRPLLGVAGFVLVAVLFVGTSPNRWGVGIALHYLSRLQWPDDIDQGPSP